MQDRKLSVQARSGEPDHAWRRAGAGGRVPGLVFGTGGLAGEYTAGRLHFLAGEILAGTIIIVPLLVGTILVAVAVFGSTRSCARAFRFLRWIADKEEPSRRQPQRCPRCGLTA